MQLQRKKKMRNAMRIMTRATHRPQLFHAELQRYVRPNRSRQLKAMVSGLQTELVQRFKVEKK